MHVLAFCAQKGGVGKTTLAGHIAVQAELSGDGPVAVVDIDPQGALTAWWQVRRTAAPAFLATTLAELPADLERLRAEGCRLAVIDTPPAITMAIQRVIKEADLIVVPVRPSPHDLRAVAGTVALVQRANKAMLFVLNGAAARARITSEATLALSEHGRVAPTSIHHRTVFAAAMADGGTAMERGDRDPSAREIEELWVYLHAQLEQAGRRCAFVQPAVHGFGRRTPDQSRP